MAGEPPMAAANDTEEAAMEQHIEIYALDNGTMAIHRNPQDPEHGYAQYVTGKIWLMSYEIEPRVDAMVRLLPADSELSPT